MRSFLFEGAHTAERRGWWWWEGGLGLEGDGDGDGDGEGYIDEMANS